MNLVIGNTSQLSYYFPEDYEKISSRNINFEQYEHRHFERIYLCFADQRTYLQGNPKELLEMFIETNVNSTLELINFFAPRCHNIVVYSTSELWNLCEGGITLQTPYNYQYSPYIKSKDILMNKITENSRNIIVLYPFNFNSIYRKSGFLFAKIFDSILYQKKIEIGNTNFYRDLIHPKYVVERSILAQEDEIVGSGRLTHVNDFIRELYQKFNLNYSQLVTENNLHNSSLKRNIFYFESQEIKYQNLMIDTINDIQQYQNSPRP